MTIELLDPRKKHEVDGSLVSPLLLIPPLINISTFFDY